MSIRWAYYPRSIRPDGIVRSIVQAFESVSGQIDSTQFPELTSNLVLQIVRPELEKINFTVESGKMHGQKVLVPVLYGINGRAIKTFEADAVNVETRWVIEVEAGRGYTNYQFLKDFFQASVMVDIDFLGLAVKNNYRGRDDFSKVLDFFDTLYSSQKMTTSLKGILVIGY